MKKYEEIDVYGESIGGGIIMETLATMQDIAEYRPICDKIRNIYLQSTFSSISRLLNKSWSRIIAGIYDFINWNDLDTYNNLHRIASGFYNRRRQKVVLIHSPTDEIVPYSESLDNFQRCEDLGMHVLHYKIRGGHNNPVGLAQVR